MILLLLFCLSFGQGQANAVSSTEASNAQQQSATQPSPIPEKPKAVQSEDESQHYQPKTQWDDPTIIVNALLFIGVVITAVIYGKQLIETRKAVRAAEESVNASYAGEAPYFGISQIAPEDFTVEYAPYAKITFVNGGKTPAWHFHSMAKAIVGKTPESGQSYDLETEWHDLPNTFFRTNDSRTFGYKSPHFRYSRELEKKLANKDVRLFMVIKIHYSDFRKKIHHRDFRLVWESSAGNFKDYDAEEQNCKACKQTE